MIYHVNTDFIDSPFLHSWVIFSCTERRQLHDSFPDLGSMNEWIVTHWNIRSHNLCVIILIIQYDVIHVCFCVKTVLKDKLEYVCIKILFDKVFYNNNDFDIECHCHNECFLQCFLVWSIKSSRQTKKELLCDALFIYMCSMLKYREKLDTGKKPIGLRFLATTMI